MSEVTSIERMSSAIDRIKINNAAFAFGAEGKQERKAVIVYRLMGC